MENQIRIAVQKSGRLFDNSIKLLKECGLSFNNGKNQLKTSAFNFPAEILFLRDDDIPQYVADQVADVGILGENVVLEKQKKIDVIEKLDFAKCRLSIAVPKSTAYEGIASLEGKNIATSYPNLMKAYLAQHGVNAGLHEISGSVEIAPSIGLADAICDLVSTGSTLLSNGLKEVEVVLRSEAVMVANPNLSPEKTAILDKLMFRIKAVNKAKNTKYLLMNVPNDAIENIKNIIPGMKSPTVMPLSDPGWSSLHSVVNEDDFWGKIDQLRKNGAQGILVVPIEKMIL